MTLISRRVEQSEWKKCVRFETLRVQPRCKLREGRDGRSATGMIPLVGGVNCKLANASVHTQLAFL